MNFFFIDLNDNVKISWEQFFLDLQTTRSFCHELYPNKGYEIIKNIIISILEEKEITLNLHENSNTIKNKNVTSTKRNNSYPVSVAELVRIIHNSYKWRVNLFTSGTSGNPKKIRHSFHSINKFIKIDERHSKNIWGLAYNLMHISGLQVLFQSIMNGNSLINLVGLKRDEVQNIFETYKVSHFSATPTFYRMNFSDGKVYKYVKRISIGGEVFTNDLLKIIKKTFPNSKTNNIYASTEFGTMLSSSDEYFTIKDSQKNNIRIKKNQIEIFALNNTENIEKFEPKWIKTGDMVSYGNFKKKFKILHRTTDLVNIGGANVSKIEVENEILKIDGIKNAKVYSKNNSLTGNLLFCDIVISMKNLDIQTINQILRSRLPKYKVPSIINIVNFIDLTQSGKINRV